MKNLEEMFNDWKSKINDVVSYGFEQGVEQGFVRGIVLGIEQGINNRNIEIAKSMKERGYSDDEILDITNISISEVGGFNGRN